ncbi:MAG TPA: hypothetical protein DEA40_08565 [Parvularcula sp.]|nr:hypothetical protein [Parvularcula sp.]
MKPELHRIGAGQRLVVVVDGLIDDLQPVVGLAAALAPFPVATNDYPGVRRVIAAHEPANVYVAALMNAAAPFIAGAFDCDAFRVIEASFSMVTRAPAALSPQQRAPHFDSTDPQFIAVLHYLSAPGGGGTAFFRQLATGIEQVSDGNVDLFVRTATKLARAQRLDAGYVRPDDPHYEMLLAVPAVAGRTLIYQGSLLHSGLIPPSAALSADPRIGRLTGNFFLKLG